MKALLLFSLWSCGSAQEPTTMDRSEAEVRDAVYFVLVDRFANGDPSNDVTVDPNSPSAWHGGDLAGVLQRIEHIDALGVGSVWLSPISATRTEPFDGWGAFHGYWTRELGEIEPRFGTFDEARQLRSELHARDLRLLLDMVYNHVGYDTPRTRSHPHWFHGNGDIVDWSSSEQKITHDVHGLPDLAQENPEVYDYLLNASLRWIRDVQPDGFRIDAVGHLPTPFLKQIGAAIHDEAGASFALLGEYFEGDPYRLATRYHSDGFTSVFDFPLHYAMVDVFCKAAHTGRIASTLSADRAFEHARATYAAEIRPHVTFLDNHDVPRVASACGGDLNRVALALAFQLTTRGTPSIYQGTEVGALGDGDPANRSDMRFVDHELTTLIRRLLDIRAVSPALHSGAVHIDRFDNDFLIYRRITDDQQALIAVNLSGTALPLLDEERQFAARSDAAYCVEQAHLQPTDRSVQTVPPHSVSLWTHRGVAPTPETTKSEQWTVRATNVPSPLIPYVRLVGSGPEVGAWSPQTAVTASRDNPLTFQFEAPSDVIFAMKLVAVMPDGSVQWSEQPDHYASWSDAAEPELSW